MMYSAIDVLSVLVISQLLLMGLYHFSFYRQHLVAQLLALLCLCLIAGVILFPNIQGGNSATQYLLERFAYATPAVLWLTVHSFFEDDHRISPLTWLILLGYQVVRAIGSLLLPEQSQSFGLFSQVSYPFMLGLVIHVIVIALRGRSGELVEPRRRLRVPFSVSLGGILAMMVSMAVIVSLLPGESQILIRSTTLVCYALLFLLALSINLATMKFAVQSVSLIDMADGTKPSQREAAKKRQTVSPRILNRIIELMDEQKLYRNVNLTIGDLAHKVHASEHKIRRVINKDLGYRNFSQFLNHYRVREARGLLLDSAQPRIHDIAFKVGYASQSSFNKAFKDITSVTPTYFRNIDGLVDKEADEALVEKVAD